MRRIANAMSFFFIGSTGDRAGHTILTWAIAQRLTEKGLRVGIMKPFGTHPVRVGEAWADHDAMLFKETLDLPDPPDRICPYLLSEEAWKGGESDTLLRHLKALVRDLLKKNDVLIIMGSRHIFFDDSTAPLPDMALINALGAPFILISRYRQASRSLYSCLSVKSMLKDKLRAAVLNRVPLEKLHEINTSIIPSLIQKGIQIAVAIPEDPFLSLRSLLEIIEILDADVLSGAESLDRPVGQVTVGSTALKGDLLAFKRVYNKVVLLQPPSMERGLERSSARGPIAGILLTGGRNPALPLLQAAEKADVPIILVREDTFSVLECLEGTAPRLSPGDKTKMLRITQLMDADSALERLIDSLGIVPA